MAETRTEAVEAARKLANAANGWYKISQAEVGECLETLLATLSTPREPEVVAEAFKRLRRGLHEVQNLCRMEHEHEGDIWDVAMDALTEAQEIYNSAPSPYTDKDGREGEGKGDS